MNNRIVGEDIILPYFEQNDTLRLSSRRAGGVTAGEVLKVVIGTN